MEKEIIKALIESDTLSKGIFWFIMDYNEDWCYEDYEVLSFQIPCDLEGATDFNDFNSRKGNSVTHERTWSQLTSNLKIGRHSWNYYPRGCVEISKGKVRIYLNPVILNCKNVEATLRRDFSLRNLPLRILPDNSKHYASHSEDERIR